MLLAGLLVLLAAAAGARAQFSVGGEAAGNEPLANSQHQKLRVNVSNICDRNQMRATVRINKPFYGLIHTKDKRRKQACFVEGAGEQTYHLDIHYTQIPSDPQHCGVVAHHQQKPAKFNETSNPEQPTLSVILVVRLHKSIEFSDDRFFLLSCANRCSRPDCASSNLISSSTNSEPISSPIISTNSNSNGHQSPTQESSVEPRAPACHDMMLELKFQWILRLCWILASLFGFAAALILCLCVSLHKLQRMHKLRNQRPAKRAATLRRTKSKQVLCAAAAAASNNDSSTAENCSWSAATTEDEVFQPKQQLLGRAHQPQMFSTALSKPAEQIRRRRSISGLHHQPPEIQVPSTMDQALPQQQERIGGKLSASQRAKSQSQTTIHYEQGQDPFKAVPFGYMNTGYPSDVPTTSPPAPDYFNQGDHSYLPATNMTGQQEVALKESPLNQRHQQQHAWPAYGTKPCLMLSPPPPPPPPQTVMGLNHHQTEAARQQQISQFDPQNSRQLIDLIQHKHRQQMVQATRTAASMHLPVGDSGEGGANNTEMQLRQPNLQHWRSHLN